MNTTTHFDEAGNLTPYNASHGAMRNLQYDYAHPTVHGISDKPKYIENFQYVNLETSVKPAINQTEASTQLSFLLPVYLSPDPTFTSFGSILLQGGQGESLTVSGDWVGMFQSHTSFLESIVDERLPPTFSACYPTYLAIDSMSQPLDTPENNTLQSNLENSNEIIYSTSNDLSTNSEIESSKIIDNNKQTYEGSSVKISPENIIDSNNSSEDQSSTKVKRVSGCDLCTKTFSSPGNLIRHTNNSHSQTKHISYICKHCSISIKRYDNYIQHQKLCAKSNENDLETQITCHTCPRCSKSYRRKQELQRHRSLKHSDHINDLHSCEICHFKTPYKNVLKRHTHNHHNKHSSLYRCSTCLIDFRTDYALTQHRKGKCTSVTDSRTCKLCCIRFRTVNVFKEHLTTEHSEALNVFLGGGKDIDDILHSFTVNDLLSGVRKSSEATVTPLELSPTYVLLMSKSN